MSYIRLVWYHFWCLVFRLLAVEHQRHDGIVSSFPFLLKAHAAHTQPSTGILLGLRAGRPRSPAWAPCA